MSNNTKNWSTNRPYKYSEDFLTQLVNTYRLPSKFMKIYSHTNDNDYTDYTDYAKTRKNNTLKKFDKLEYLLDKLDSVLYELSDHIRQFHEEGSNLINASIAWEYQEASDNIKIYRNTMMEMKHRLVNNKFSDKDIKMMNSIYDSIKLLYKSLSKVIIRL